MQPNNLDRVARYESSYPTYALGKHIDRASHLLKTVGFENMVRHLRTPPDFPTDIKNLPHPAGPLLDYLRCHGAPVKTTTAPWSQAQKDEAILRGPHQSALLHTEFLEEEMADMAAKGQWLVLPYELLRHLPQLRISPIGVVPQHERRPRTIVDLSFFGVNAETVPLAPSESMQFGRTLQRLLQKLVAADPRYGPTYLIKVDISDGFYRIHLNPHDAPVLGVAFPPAPDGTKLVAIPLTLPMGWVLSPPFFTAATETIADITNVRLQDSTDHPQSHRLDNIADAVGTEDPPRLPGCGGPEESFLFATPPPFLPVRTLRRKPLQYTDLYMDDFIQAVQGGTTRRSRARRILFDTIDQVFQPLESAPGKNRQEPISLKKLQKGDARWATRKNVLGWIIDTVDETIELPPRRLARLESILNDLPRSRTRISVKVWHQVLGELRSMTLAIPGLRGFFSLLQEALRHVEQRRLRLTSATHDFLDDIRWLVQTLHARPTRFREVVPTTLRTVGACDACQQGMGGVLFLPTKQGTFKAILWRAPFPAQVQNQLVSWSNPAGTISNSDLELAGTIAQHDVLAHEVDVRECTIATLTDNTPAQAWQHKGSTTTTGPAAYLLRLQALHQRHFRYLPQVHYIPGPANAMADDCSRRWDLSDAQLISHFNSFYPQTSSWHLCRLRPAMLSCLTSALQRQRPELASMLQPKLAPIANGLSGHDFVATCIKTRSLLRSAIPPSSYKSLPSASGTADIPLAAGPLDIAQYLRPSVQWARRWPFWGPLIPGLTPQDKSISALHGKFAPTSSAIPLPNASNPFPWKLSSTLSRESSAIPMPVRASERQVI